MPEYYADWELTDYKIEYETRRQTILIRGFSPILVISRQVRQVFLKTYEGTIQDANPAVAELPAPSYLAGTSAVTPNPENLSPVGWQAGQWHLSDMQYNKALDTPLSRKIKITWEQYGPWMTVETEEDSDSQ